MAHSHCTEGGPGMGPGPAQQETMGQVPVPVSDHCGQYNIRYRNPLFLFLFLIQLPFRFRAVWTTHYGKNNIAHKKTNLIPVAI